MSHFEDLQFVTFYFKRSEDDIEATNKTSFSQQPFYNQVTMIRIDKIRVGMNRSPALAVLKMIEPPAVSPNERRCSRGAVAIGRAVANRRPKFMKKWLPGEPTTAVSGSVATAAAAARASDGVPIFF